MVSLGGWAFSYDQGTTVVAVASGLCIILCVARWMPLNWAVLRVLAQISRGLVPGCADWQGRHVGWNRVTSLIRPPPRWTLQKPYAEGPTVILGVEVFFCGRGTTVADV